MNYKIFIEYNDVRLSNISDNLYNLFLENNYDVELLNNNIPQNEKIALIKNSNKKNLVISNKINNNSTNDIEIIYPLRSNDSLARTLNDNLSNIVTISKYYQLRATGDTSLDYYEILRNINNNEAIILRYGANTLNNSNLPNFIFRSITNYLTNENIYTVQSGDTIYAIARRFNVTVNDIKSLNNLTSNSLSIGQKLLIPTTNIQENGETPIEDNPNIYTVKSGDSLYSIARNFNTTVNQIKSLNNLTSNNLSIGQRLLITSIESSSPTPTNNTYTVKSGDSLYSIARNFNTSVDQIKSLNNLTSNNLSIGQKLLIPFSNEETNSPSTNSYTVKSGDSLYSIARTFNISVNDIKSLNNLTSNNLSIGQKLLIPSNQGTSSSNIYTVKSGDSLYAIARNFNTSVDNIKRLNNLTSNNLSIGQKIILN